MKSGKEPIPLPGSMKLVPLVKETGMAEDYARCDRPSLKKDHLSRVVAEIKVLMSESVTETSSAWEANRHLGIAIIFTS